MKHAVIFRPCQTGAHADCPEADGEAFCVCACHTATDDIDVAKHWWDREEE